MLIPVACRKTQKPLGFLVTNVDAQVTGHSRFPTAVNPSRVGSYSPDTKSGAGYFYDDVLEYRVWLHPENGAVPLNGTNDYFAAFAQFESAEEFSKKTPGAETPLVLVRQREWIDEPSRGHFVPEKGDRITEWQVVWLRDS